MNEPLFIICNERMAVKLEEIRLGTLEGKPTNKTVFLLTAYKLKKDELLRAGFTMLCNSKDEVIDTLAEIKERTLD